MLIAIDIICNNVLLEQPAHVCRLNEDHLSGLNCLSDDQVFGLSTLTKFQLMISIYWLL